MEGGPPKFLKMLPPVLHGREERGAGDLSARRCQDSLDHHRGPVTEARG